jgi:hypothetical protein
MFARLTHRQLLRLVPVAKVTDHFHTDWYRNRAALRQGLSILDGIFIVEGVAPQKIRDQRTAGQPQFHGHRDACTTIASGCST